MLAGHVMAFENVVEQRHGPLEQTDRARMTDRDANEGGNIFAQLAGINRRMVARNKAAIFKLLDALDPVMIKALDIAYTTRERGLST